MLLVWRITDSEQTGQLTNGSKVDFVINVTEPLFSCSVMVYGTDVANAVADTLIARCCLWINLAGLSDVGAGIT